MAELLRAEFGPLVRVSVAKLAPVAGVQADGVIIGANPAKELKSPAVQSFPKLLATSLRAGVTRGGDARVHVSP